jgi:acetyl esterase/lipase
VTLLKTTLAAIGLVCALAFPAQAREADRSFPVPQTVSPEIQGLIGAEPWPFWNLHPKDAQEWKAFDRSLAEAVLAALPALLEQMGVTLTADVLAGVPVLVVTPKDLPARNADRVLLHFHGGGYVLGSGKSGVQEAVLMAGIGGFRVVSPDYRLAQDHPYPAAMDDAVAVYKALLKTTSAEKIGVFGASTGGGMTLALILRAKAENLPLPAGIAAGTPWSDLSKTGDSYFTNEHVDNLLVSYDGWLGEAARLYAAGRDLKDPMLSPVYGEVSGFPPTLLTSGTRDLFLSNTVRMHLKLRQAGVNADLIVFEGMSHAQYHILPDAPETRFHFTELGKFFDRHLK